MIQLFLPDHLEAVAQRSIAIPEKFAHASVPFQKCIHKDWDTGAFLMLWKTGAMSDLCITHFQLQEKVVVEAVSAQDVFVFHFMLEGTAQLHYYGAADSMKLHAGMFNLFMVPKSSRIPVVLERGRYKSCHLFLLSEDIAVMGSDIESIQKLIEAWKNGATILQPCAVFAPITDDIKSLLTLLEVSDLPRPQLYAAIQKGILNIFEEYAHAVNAYLNRLKVKRYEIAQTMTIHRFITANFDAAEATTIKALAGKAGISVTTLKKNFVALYGMGIHAYLTTLRLQRAATLLAGTKESATTIAYRVGYHSAAAFHYAFLKAYGCKPNEYRKKIQQQRNASEF